MLTIVVIALSYVLGSIPSGLILGKLVWQVDLREHGSRNIGATNAWRTLGKVPGIIVFMADFIKGVGGVYLGLMLVGTPEAAVLGGFTSIIGHTFSLFLGFKGGKGVATALGVLAILMPQLTLIIFSMWLVIVYFSRYVSLGSVVAGAAAPLLTYIMGYPTAYLIFASLVSTLVIIRHQENIARLLAGTESKIR